MNQSKSDKQNQENQQSNSSKASKFCYSSSSFIDNPNSGEQKYSRQEYQSHEIGLFEQFLRGLSTNTGKEVKDGNEPTLNFDSCADNMIQSLFQIIEQQNIALKDLSDKIQSISQKTAKLTQKYNFMQEDQITIKQQLKELAIQKHFQEPEPRMVPKFEGEQVNGEQMLQILFGRKDYSYFLQLKENLTLPIFRERNFNLKVELLNEEQILVKNFNKIPMNVTIYTCQNPPKFLQKNTSGQKMLKGFTEQSLLNGQCIFDKIQIRQVSSHYRKGWIFLVIAPSMSPLGTEKSENFIDYKDIKPLVLGNVVVRAKKPKPNKNFAENDSEISRNEVGLDD